MHEMRISLRGRRRAPSLRPPSLAPGIGLQQKGFRFSNAVYMWIVCTTKGMTRGGGSSLGGPAAGVGALGCIGAFRRLYWPQIDAPQTVTSVIMGRPAEKPATPTCVAASPGGGRLLLPPPPWPTSVCRSFQRTTEKTQQRYMRIPPALRRTRGRQPPAAPHWPAALFSANSPYRYALDI